MRRLTLALYLTLGLCAAEAQAAPPATAVHTCTLSKRRQIGGKAPRATVMFLHGTADAPNGAIGQRLVDELRTRGIGLVISAPWLRPVTREADGTLKKAGDQSFTDGLQRAQQALDHEKGPVIVVGHSLGGKIALELARRNPQRISGTVALAPAVSSKARYWAKEGAGKPLPDNTTLEATFRTLRQDLEQLVDRSPPGLQRGNAALRAAIMAVNEDVAHYDEESMERDVKTPTVVLSGTHDAIVPIGFVRAFAQKNVTVTLRELQGIDHMLASKDKPTTDAAIRAIADEIVAMVDKSN